MFTGLFALKAVSEAPEQGPQALNRTLSLPALTAFGIGAIIGTGIFVLTGTAAANHAGPALVLSFILAGVGSALAALCYAELASMLPIAGSAYSYAYATLGELTAWFIGWNLVLEYTFSVGSVAVGWSGYVVSLLTQFGIQLPETLTHAPIDRGTGDQGLVTTGAIINLPAVLIVVAVATVCYIGIRQSAAINSVIVVIKIAVVIVFVLLGAGVITAANWTPFIPPNRGHFGEFGWSGVIAAAGIIFFAYIGFDAVSTCAQEAKNPRRDVPLSILASLGICTVLYIATALVLTGMVPYTDLDVAAPVALALDRHPELRWLGIPVKIGAIAGMTSVMLVMTVGQARIFLSMSGDGLLPPWFARIHPRFRTPSQSTIVTAIGATIIAGLLPVRILGELVSIGTLLAFVTVCIGVLVLRRLRPDLPRRFRVPAPVLTCSAGALICGGLMVALPGDTWIRLAVWTFIGSLIYVFYGYRNSRLRRTAQGFDPIVEPE
jgi:APA family basic amino acid/polyamine antiporter